FSCVTPERARCARAVVLRGLLGVLGAGEGDRGPAGPPGGSGGGGNPNPPEPTPTAYAAGEPVPELVASIDSIGGASGASGAFLPGDSLSVEFTLSKANGDPWTLEELKEGQALVSGPSFNYQRVLPATDVRASATALGGGRFRFAFPTPIPANFEPPYNDSPSFGLSQGELAGRALLDGTYTLGISFAW